RVEEAKRRRRGYLDRLQQHVELAIEREYLAANQANSLEPPGDVFGSRLLGGAITAKGQPLQRRDVDRSLHPLRPLLVADHGHRAGDVALSSVKFPEIGSEHRLLDHGVAELAQEFHRGVEGGLNLGMQSEFLDGFGAERDAQAAGRGLDLVEIRPRLWRGRIRRVVFRIAGPVEQGGAVAHRARHDVIDDEAMGAAAIVWPAGISGLRRLHAEQAALRGWNADGTEAVRGMRHRHDAAGDRRRGAARRSAGAVVRLPRVVAIAEEAALG